jgi:hypothetical protein
VPNVRADRAIGQASRRAGEHEPGQHVGLELRDFHRARRNPSLARSGTTASPNPRPHLQPHRNILNLIENHS